MVRAHIQCNSMTNLWSMLLHQMKYIYIYDNIEKCMHNIHMYFTSDYLYFWNNLNDRVIKLSLDWPFWYFLSTGSKLDLQLVFQKGTGKACERGTRNAIFRSMTI